jgi:hypothetical protein
MKGFVLGILVGAAIAVAASAAARPHGKTVELVVGDTASIGSGLDATNCTVLARRGAPSFSCWVGDDEYRKRYSMTIDPAEVTATKYFGPQFTRKLVVIFRRTQTNTHVAWSGPPH